MFFPYWNHNTCICYDYLYNLERAIIKLLEQETGCYRLNLLPKLDCKLSELKTRPSANSPNLWIIALFQNKPGWTIIKTFPPRILAQIAFSSNIPRLAYLTKQLQCKAFHLDIRKAT